MKWQGRGFNNYVKRLMVLLAAGSMHRAELEVEHTSLTHLSNTSH